MRFKSETELARKIARNVTCTAVVCKSLKDIMDKFYEEVRI